MPGRRGPGRQHQTNSKTRLLRNRNYGAATNAIDNTAVPSSISTKLGNNVENVTLLPICHPAIPDLQRLSSMMFEALFLLYLHTALFCQYIYLYKTVWWYPVTLPPSTTSLNFHLIDHNLTLFLTVFLSRRLLWALLWDVVRPSSDNSPGILAWILLCFFAGIMWICFLLGPLIYLYYSTSLLNMLVLCYPIILWLPLTGLSGDSCLNLVLSWASFADADHTASAMNLDGNDSGGQSQSAKQSNDVPHMTRLLDHPETTGDLKTSYANLGNALDAQQVREEVRLLCRDFNSRISEIVFCSMVCAYYVGLVPMFFMKAHHYYDIPWCLQHTVLVLLNSFTLLSMQLLHPRYLHVLHKCASLLGGYEEENADDKANNFTTNCAEELMNDTLPANDIHEWSNYTVFSPGTRVRYKDKIYVSIGKHNAAEPDDATHARFFFMFNNPLKLLTWLLIAHTVIVLYQIQLLLSSSKWHQLISVALLQFFSYYVLFRMLRDRLILGKAYSLHEQIYKDAQPS